MSIILKGQDGSVAIMELAPGADKDEAIRKFKEAHEGAYLEHYEGEFKLPKDRQFRDAWTLRNNEIVVDGRKAKKLHMSHIRDARNKALEQLDKEQLRALLDAGKLNAIEEKKEILRQLPKNVKGLEWPIELEK